MPTASHNNNNNNSENEAGQCNAFSMHHTAEGALVAATKSLSTETKIKHNLGINHLSCSYLMEWISLEQ